MATRDEIIRLLIETGGTKDVEALGRALDLLEREATGSTEALGRIADDLQKLQAAGNAAERLNELRDAQQRAAETSERLGANLSEVAKREGELARELASRKAALDEARRAQEEYRDGEDKTAAKTREMATAVREARDAVKEATGAWKSATRDLKGATADYDRAAAAQEKLAAAAAPLAAALQSAGVSTTNLGDSQRLLGELADEARAKLADQAKYTETLARQQGKMAGEAKSAADSTRKLNAEGERGAGIFSKLGGVLSTVMAAFSVKKIVDGLKSVFTAASETEQVLGQLDAALASTGNAAGLSAAELVKMGEELGKVTNYTTDQIATAQTRLLSYTSVARDQFPAAMQVILDQSARLGMSVEQSAEIIGQALEQPSNAMVRLAKQGFSFTQQQKELIATLEATGRSAEAQSIIIDMLTESYGGAATAQRIGTFAGAIKGVGDAIDGLRKKVVSGPVMDRLQDEINATSAAFDSLANSEAFDRFRQDFEYAFTAALESVRIFRENADLEGLTGELGGLVRAFGDVVTIANAMEERTGILGDGFGELMDAVNPLGRVIDLLGPKLHLVATELRASNETLSETGTQAEASANAFELLSFAANAVQESVAKVVELTWGDGLSAGAYQLAEKLRGSADAAAASEKEIRALIGTIADLTPGQISDIALALAKVASESDRTEKHVRDGLTVALKDLSGEQLLAFANAAEDAFRRFQTGADQAAVVSETVLLTALERLGLKGSQLGQEITRGGQDIIDTFKVVAQSAEATGEQIESAFKAALNAAATKAEAEALAEALKIAGDSGRISMDGMARATDQLNSRLRALRNELDPLNDAFETLGIRSQAALDGAAKTAADAFARISAAAANGTATLADARAAFEAYARAQLDAAANLDGATRASVENMLRLKGGAIGATDSLQRLGLVGAESTGSIGPPADGAASSLHGLAAAADRAGGSVTGLGESSETAAGKIDQLGNAAGRQAASMGQMSQEAAAAYESLNRFVSANSGTGGSWTAEMNRLTQAIEEQRKNWESEVEALDQAAKGYDELSSYLQKARADYKWLTEEQIRQVAERRKAADDAAAAEKGSAQNAREQNEAYERGNETLRERNQLLEKQQQATQRKEIDITVAFEAKASRVVFDASDISDAQWRQVAARVIEIIKRDMQ